MKTTLKKLLVIVLALTCIMGLVACAPAPKKDLEKAKDALEDEKYSVSYSDEDDSGDGIEERLYATDGKDNYLYILKFEKTSTAKLYYKSLVNENDNELALNKAYLKYYEHILKNFEDDMDDKQVDSYEDNIEEYEEEIEDAKELVIGRSGKIVWIGTKQAIKDSKN